MDWLIHMSCMTAFAQIAFSGRFRPVLASLAFFSCVLSAACSSGGPEPGNSAGRAGAAAGAGAAASSNAGAAGTAGSVSSSGSSQGGSATGGGAAAVAGGGAGGAGNASGAAGTGGVANAPFTLTSTAFTEGDEIPLKYKCMNVNPIGQNISPPLSWGLGPLGTKSYAVVLMHVPSPEHWVLWDIPANVTSLPENIEHAAQPTAPAGSKQSLANLDGFTGSGYLGPCPQAAKSRQSYQFTVYALDVEQVPGLSATSTPAQAATAVKAHLVPGSQGVSLTGTQIQTP